MYLTILLCSIPVIGFFGGVFMGIWESSRENKKIRKICKNCDNGKKPNEQPDFCSRFCWEKHK